MGRDFFRDEPRSPRFDATVPGRSHADVVDFDTCQQARERRHPPGPSTIIFTGVILNLIEGYDVAAWATARPAEPVKLAFANREEMTAAA
jgi:hypothetical protein